MAENTVSLGKSPEEIAYKLMLHIADVENKDLSPGSVVQGKTKADRAWILQAYWNCYTVAKLGVQPQLKP